MLKIRYENSFKRDYKRIIKRGYNSQASDWLLIYRINNDELELCLTRTGTHSDLFGK